MIQPVAVFAATFVVPNDEAMVARSHAIVRGSVLTVYSQMTPEGGIETVASISVDEVIKGKIDETSITVREPGGRVGNLALVIAGSPHFTPGDEVLLFLRRIPDGWATTDLVLGKFALARDPAGQELFLREEDEVRGWSVSGAPHMERRRAAEPFLNFLRKAATGVAQPMAEDYFVESSGATEPVKVKALVSAAATFAASTYTMAFNTNSERGKRWNTFPGQVSWVNQNTLSGAPNGGVDSINTGLAAWTNDSGSNVNCVYTGANSGATGGLSSPDSRNSVRFEVDLSGRGIPPYSCGSGGTIAVGGFWTNGTTHVHPGGETFDTISEGDVDVNRGLAGCSSFTSSGNFLTAMTHELGHTLAFRHSNQDRLGGACTASFDCNSGAVMNSVVVNGLNATLQTWDVTAVRTVYPGSSPPPPPPPPCTAPTITSHPSNLNGGGTLTVGASGTTPLSYQWYMGISGDTTSQPVPGATGPSLSIFPQSNTSYWARVSNACGAANSNSATIFAGRVPYDFFGDWTSNALFRNNATGAVALWELRGRTLLSGDIFANLDANTRVAGVGDFNGDGRADVVLRNFSSGLVTIWLMSGRTILASVAVRTVSLSLNIAALGDFNRDGRTDLVWRHSGTGEVSIWNMNGASVLSEGSVIVIGDLNWQIQLGADFTGDGFAEILWRHATTLQLAMWEMSNRTLLNGNVFATMSDPGYRVEGAGDFNGDGRADIFWRHNSSGWVGMWEMNGRTIINGAAIIRIPDLNWNIEAFGDYDGNGRTDVLVRHMTTGDVAMWEFNGHQFLNGNIFFRLESTNWRMQPPQKPIPGF